MSRFTCINGRISYKNPCLQNSRDYSDCIWTPYLLIRREQCFLWCGQRKIYSFFFFLSELEFVLIKVLDVRLLPILWNFHSLRLLLYHSLAACKKSLSVYPCLRHTHTRVRTHTCSLLSLWPHSPTIGFCFISEQVLWQQQKYLNVNFLLYCLKNARLILCDTKTLSLGDFHGCLPWFSLLCFCFVLERESKSCCHRH